MKIMHMHGIFHNVIAKIVRLSINYSWCNTATSHPYTETAWMVIAAVIFLFQFTLAIIGSTKFAAPYY